MRVGYLASHILEYFRGSFVERIDLSASLSDEDGLNQLKPQALLESKSCISRFSPYVIFHSLFSTQQLHTTQGIKFGQCASR